MSAGEIVAITFAAASTVILLTTFYVIRKTYREKMDETAKVLGVGRQIAAELERDGQLQGALGLGRPVAISPRSLEILLDCKNRGTQ